MTLRDQTGRTITLSSLPQRIVSIVPSQTELLFDLGLDDEVVGITKFCIHPDSWFRTKTRVGGTKQLHPDKIRELKPHLIIANKEENVKEQVEELANEFPVWTSDISNLPEALEMIREVGKITGKQEKAHKIAEQVQYGFHSLSTSFSPLHSRPKACYLIWKDPYMSVGGDTFIHDMMERCGLQNMFAHQKRYPQVSVEEIRSSGCEAVLLSSEPYPFREKHVLELREMLGENMKIMLVDGELFSWYGSRLLQSPRYFEELGRRLGLNS
jgi:ABC-type Fe3+-hydroxamate transport system substrate-binding protein